MYECLVGKSPPRYSQIIFLLLLKLVLLHRLPAVLLGEPSSDLPEDHQVGRLPADP